tara:strand:+ start:437 stop:544 length:108 start_codon:yes stop_codon:yes gene_type:complete
METLVLPVIHHQQLEELVVVEEQVELLKRLIATLH